MKKIIVAALVVLAGCVKAPEHKTTPPPTIMQNLKEECTVISSTQYKNLSRMNVRFYDSDCNIGSKYYHQKYWAISRDVNYNWTVIMNYENTASFPGNGNMCSFDYGSKPGSVIVQCNDLSEDDRKHLLSFL